ncbi:MAG: hypothetical protein V1809_14475 [Planctomycetota bacterium]
MAAIDDVSEILLEEAKRFLEKAQTEVGSAGKTAYLHAALNLGFCSLEAHVNAIADDFLTRKDLSVLDRSILREKDYRLNEGEFTLNEAKLRMYRLEDRIQFLHRRFSGKRIDLKSSWWSELQSAQILRNKLAHPKDAPVIDEDSVIRGLQSILDTINALYTAIYKRKFPGSSRGLQSNLTF